MRHIQFILEITTLAIILTGIALFMYEIPSVNETTLVIRSIQGNN